MADSSSEQEEGQRLRLDKWLWAARFFKTRALASEAVQGGHVQLNGGRVKPSRALRVGDQLQIRKGSLTFTITVLLLSARRGPATVAATLYQESAASLAARAAAAEARRLAAATAPERRPDKRARRHIVRFSGKG